MIPGIPPVCDPSAFPGMPKGISEETPQWIPHPLGCRDPWDPLKNPLGQGSQRGSLCDSGVVRPWAPVEGSRVESSHDIPYGVSLGMPLIPPVGALGGPHIQAPGATHACFRRPPPALCASIYPSWVDSPTGSPGSPPTWGSPRMIPTEAWRFPAWDPV